MAQSTLRLFHTSGQARTRGSPASQGMSSPIPPLEILTSKSQLSVAFVGYGTADTVPSPILCKRFFSDNRMVYKEAFDDPLHFGIGKTNSGGNRGMSALEGLVSALEVSFQYIEY